MLTSTVCQPPMPADVIANALLGKGIGNILFPRTVGFPHCWLCSYCNVSPTQNVVWSYTRYSSQCCIGAIAIPSTSSWTTTKQQCWTNKNVEYQWENGFIVWDYSPLWLAPNYNPVNIIRLGYIRSIWLICTSCNSSIRCRTSRAAPFARSRCNCNEHVCKWYW